MGGTGSFQTVAQLSGTTGLDAATKTNASQAQRALSQTARCVASGGPVLPLDSLPPRSNRSDEPSVEHPEVMVKVTGGSTKTGAVAAHLAYISRRDELAIETDEGDRAAGRDAQKALLSDSHIDLSAGQYRAPREPTCDRSGSEAGPQHCAFDASPTPADKVLETDRRHVRCTRRDYVGRGRTLLRAESASGNDVERPARKSVR